MTIRDIRQKEFGDVFLQSGESGILYLCPRFGKCRVGIYIFKKLNPNSKILICYPDNKIKNSWEQEFEELDYDGSNITFTNFRSLNKKSNIYDLIVIDEIHLLSPNQIAQIKRFKGTRILGLTGSMNEETKLSLRLALKLNILAEYPIDMAIKEGILIDYEINVQLVDLSSKDLVYFNNRFKSEKAHYDTQSYLIDKLIKENKDPSSFILARMRMIQNSISKIKLTNELLKKI